MPEINSKSSSEIAGEYLATLISNVAQFGHADGFVAMEAGHHDLYETGAVDVAANTLARVGVSPVDPCFKNRPGAGLSAFFDEWPVGHVKIKGLPMQVAVHTLHLNGKGKLHGRGKVGPKGLRHLDKTILLGDLSQPIAKIDKDFKALCAKITSHPMFSVSSLLALEKSSLEFDLEGGPTIEFDAQGRLPYKGLQSKRTRVLLAADTVASQSEPGVRLSLIHECDMLRTDGKSEPLKIELSARLGAHDDAVEEETPIDPAVTTGEQAGQSSQNANGAGEDKASPVAPYVAAIYAGLMDTLPLKGELTLAEQRWSELSKLAPQVAQRLGNCRINCKEGTQVKITREGDWLRAEAREPIHITIPAESIPVQLGWLRRLLSSMLMAAIHAVQLQPGSIDAEGNVKAEVDAEVGLKIGRWQLGHFKVRREVTLTVPRDPEIFTEIDSRLANIAESYTYTALVNASHLISLDDSKLSLTSKRFGQIQLAEGRTLHGKHTAVFMGACPEGRRMSLVHDARLVTPNGKRPLELSAAFTLTGKAPAAEQPAVPQPSKAERSPRLRFTMDGGHPGVRVRLL